MFAAVLDTCTLYAGIRRDLLLSMSVLGVYRMVLGDELLDEIERVDRLKRCEQGTEPAAAQAGARYLVDQLRANFDLENAERLRLLKDVGLPDPEDEHVLKLALVGGADVIVTDNLRDFPRSALPGDLRLQRPVDFLHDMVTADRAAATAALVDMSARRRRPPQSVLDLLDIMVIKGHMRGETADVLRRELKGPC